MTLSGVILLTDKRRLDDLEDLVFDLRSNQGSITNRLAALEKNLPKPEEEWWLVKPIHDGGEYFLDSIGPFKDADEVEAALQFRPDKGWKVVRTDET